MVFMHVILISLMEVVFFPAKEAGQSASISQEERGFRFRGLAIQDERSPGSVASKLKIF